MPTEILVIVIAAAFLLAVVFSWLGVRKLAQKHTRSVAADSPLKLRQEIQQVAFIYNPTKSGSAQAKVLIARSVSKAGWPAPIFLETTAEDPGYLMASEALRAKSDVVIVGGGDGTVRAVAQTLRHSEVPGSSREANDIPRK